MVETRETQNHREHGAKLEHYTAESILTELRKGHPDEAMRELNRDRWSSPGGFPKLYGEVKHGIEALNHSKHLNLPKLELVHPDGKIDGDATSKFTAYKLGDTKYSTRSVRQKESITPGTTASAVSGNQPEEFRAVGDNTNNSTRPNDTAARNNSTNPNDAAARNNSTNPNDAAARNNSTNPNDAAARNNSTNPNDAAARNNSTNPNDAASASAKRLGPGVKEVTAEEFTNYNEAVKKADPSVRGFLPSQVGYVDQHGSKHITSANGDRFDEFSGNGPADPEIGEVRSQTRKASGERVLTNANGDVKTINSDKKSFKIQYKNGDSWEHNGVVDLRTHVEPDGTIRQNHTHQGDGYRYDNWQKTFWKDGSTEYVDMDKKKIKTPATTPAAQ